MAAATRALRHRGPDGERQSVAGSIGFGCQHLWVTPEETGEFQPLVAPSGVMLVMDGRLDNRDELIPQLGLARETSDAACVMAAYDAWEDGFAVRLNGDFAVALFDHRRHRLLLARDAIGIRPLYYFRSTAMFAFASEIKALLALPDVAVRPDDEGIADFLLVGTRPVDRQEITCFEGISALVPAHLAIVTPERTVSRRYWDFDTAATLKLRSFDEYVEGFRERFAESVRRRLRSSRPVVVSVSGGLDSSSIFCQAQVLKRTEASRPEVKGLSYIGAERTEADEREYLLEIERQYDVDIARFPMDQFMTSVPDVAEQVHAIEAPFVDYSWSITREVPRRTAAAGSRVLLTGHWGDEVMFSSAYLSDLFCRLAWAEMRRHIRQYARSFSPALTRLLARRVAMDIVRHRVPGVLVRPLKWVRLKLFAPQRRQPWFSDAFMRRACRFATRPARIGHGFHSAQARCIYLEARSKYHVQCMEWNNKVGAMHGLDMAFPFLDRDLLAFMMATPGEIQNQDGVPRALLRAAMRGILPDRVRLRQSKAEFTAVINGGVARDADAISKALSPDSLSVRLGYLDHARLERELARLSARLAGPHCVRAWDLANLVGLETWLQLFVGDPRRSVPQSRDIQESVA
jgi:asparagine synthase (glutamine-hydrolysing)